VLRRLVQLGRLTLHVERSWPMRRVLLFRRRFLRAMEVAPRPAERRRDMQWRQCLCPGPGQCVEWESGKTGAAGSAAWVVHRQVLRHQLCDGKLRRFQGGAHKARLTATKCRCGKSRHFIVRRNVVT
jgi:hypothetical protein